MERLLLRRMNRVLRYTARDEVFKVLLQFPSASFEKAPQWSPGEGFIVCIDNYSWYRRNPREGTFTAVVTGVGPKRWPAYDGGEWKKPEVWTIELPGDSWLLPELWDRPHRVSWLLDPNDPEMDGTILKRQPLAGHPSEELLQYWDAFEHKWGFLPQRRKDQPAGPLDPYYLRFTWCRDESSLTLSELARGIAWLVRRFDARFSIWSNKQQLDAYSDDWRHTNPALNTNCFYVGGLLLR